MIGFDAAIGLLREAAAPIGVETVALGDAHRRVLAQDVAARTDSPRCDSAAMDGYAVREADLVVLPAQLKVVGESAAGGGFDGEVPAGGCVRIFTGAPVPAGADRVVIQEIVGREGDVALFAEAPSPPRHIRPRGLDFAAGDVLLEAGRLLDSRAVVAAAAADVSSLKVFRRPRLFVLGSGDELVEPGLAADTPGAIPESISRGVAAFAADWGAEPIGRRLLPDDLAAMIPAAGEALAAAELVVVTGGASVGERDFAKAMFEPHGLALIFSKVAIKPGKPVWLGRAGGKLVLGLPGNPSSALVTARLFLAPLLCGLTGRVPEAALRWRRVALANGAEACGDRETFARARWRGEAAELLGNQDSSAQRTLAAADLLVRRRAGVPSAKAGEMVEVLDF